MLEDPQLPHRPVIGDVRLYCRKHQIKYTVNISDIETNLMCPSCLREFEKNGHVDIPLARDVIQRYLLSHGLVYKEGYVIPNTALQTHYYLPQYKIHIQLIEEKKESLHLYAALEELNFLTRAISESLIIIPHFALATDHFLPYLESRLLKYGVPIEVIKA